MRLSVIVPVYNVQSYLEECLTSLLLQTEPFDEIILINDGSTDKSKDICESYCKQYNNFILINQNNRGLAATRNLGLQKAMGDYVIFVDSDDYIKKETNILLKKALQLEKVEALYYNAEIRYDISFKEKEDAFKHANILNEKYLTGIDYLTDVFPRKYTVSACLAAYKREFLLQNHILFPEGVYFEDNFFSLQVLTKAKKVFGISNSLYVRRYRENSIMTSKTTKKKCQDLVTIQKIMWEYLLENQIWSKKRKLLKRFVASGLLSTFFELSKFQDKALTNGLKCNLAKLFLDSWIELFFESDNDWGTDLAFLLALKYGKLIPGGLKRNAFLKKVTFDEMIKCQEKMIKDKITIELSALPFEDKKLRVGIYGIGKHTQLLIKLYQKEIGEIHSNIFFIVSSNEGVSDFCGKPIFLYNEIPCNVDYIVLSSYLYQQEMYNNLCEIGFDEKRIFTLYKATDICDLIMLDWVMRE